MNMTQEQVERYEHLEFLLGFLKKHGIDPNAFVTKALEKSTSLGSVILGRFPELVMSADVNSVQSFQMLFDENNSRPYAIKDTVDGKVAPIKWSDAK